MDHGRTTLSSQWEIRRFSRWQPGCLVPLALGLLGAGHQENPVERRAEILCGLQAHAQMRHDHPIPDELPADTHVPGSRNTRGCLLPASGPYGRNLIGTMVDERHPAPTLVSAFRDGSLWPSEPWSTAFAYQFTGFLG
jgi:hypothetical protein